MKKYTKINFQNETFNIVQDDDYPDKVFVGWYEFHNEYNWLKIEHIPELVSKAIGGKWKMISKYFNCTGNGHYYCEVEKYD